jgi:hypothetical protein
VPPYFEQWDQTICPAGCWGIGCALVDVNERCHASPVVTDCKTCCCDTRCSACRFEAESHIKQHVTIVVAVSGSPCRDVRLMPICMSPSIPNRSGSTRPHSFIGSVSPRLSRNLRYPQIYYRAVDGYNVDGPAREPPTQTSLQSTLPIRSL